MPKSLNYVSRKHLILKIEDDNLRLAKKLMEANSSLNKKTLDMDYKQYSKYRDQIIRVAKKHK
jgi:hypothetical protein